MNSNSDLKDRIEKNLQENSITNTITIDVLGEEVTLKGIVDSYEIKDKIEQIVLRFSEVEAVNNELAIFNENQKYMIPKIGLSEESIEKTIKLLEVVLSDVFHPLNVVYCVL